MGRFLFRLVVATALWAVLFRLAVATALWAVLFCLVVATALWAVLLDSRSFSRSPASPSD